MLKIEPRATLEAIQGFLGGQLYYNAKIPSEELQEFLDLIRSHYLPKLEELLKENKEEKDIVQDALQNKFFAKMSDFPHLKGYAEQEFSAGHKQNAPHKKVAGAVDFVLKKNERVMVIVEAKKPSSLEMISEKDCNKRALHEAILYYLRERELASILNLQDAVQYIVITDFYQFFIFKENEFDRFFYQNRFIYGLYKKYKSLQLSEPLAKEKEESIRNAQFYAELEKHFQTYLTRDGQHPTLRPLHLNLAHLEGENPVLKDITPFFKALMPDFLLSKFEAPKNEVNNLFYKELLYILGLEESKNKTISPNHVAGTLFENVQESLPQESDQTFENILSLIITWLNRILFLKLIEANLVRFNGEHCAQSLRFLNAQNIADFQTLDYLFFEIFAKKHALRDEHSPFYSLPYFNSSLFAPTALEKKLIRIKNLSNHKKLIPFANHLSRTSGQPKALLAYLLDFLDGFNFGSGEMYDHETLISANILGNVFERLNAYKEGSFYTHYAITNYMCQNSMEKMVLNAFNTQFNWQCADFIGLKKRIDREFDTQEQAFKNTLQNLRICDPAVGSGHFLVATLNRMIKIYADLGLLEGYLQRAEMHILGDELVVDFIYTRPQNAQDITQQMQKALFELKRNIIENNLFGVDINPNSVEICKLRLWIELLKGSYYLQENDADFDALAHQKGAHQMQTLPNIDINIKCGNSLISRFGLEEHFPGGNMHAQIADYKKLVQDYKNTPTKAFKNELEAQIQAICQNFTLLLLDSKTKAQLEAALSNHLARFGETMLQEKWFEGLAVQRSFQFGATPLNEQQMLEAAESVKQIILLRMRLDENLKGSIYKNAVEWRFEFPEVLDSNGDFMGFDLIIGNPPYIRQEEIKELKPHLQKSFNIYCGTSDIYTYFYERGHSLLKAKGILTLITSNKFCRAGYGANLRAFLLQSAILDFVDLNGVKVFDKATVDTCIVNLSKQKPTKSHALNYANPNAKDLSTISYSQIPQDSLSSEAFIFVDSPTLALKQKIEKIGTPLKQWDIEINYGIKTGYNEAFIIDTATKDRILDSCESVAEKERTAQIIKPILRGRDIKRYSYEWANLWLIFLSWHFPNTQNPKSMDENEKDLAQLYPSLYRHLLKHKDNLSKRNKAETGIRYEWYCMQRYGANYYEDFGKEKIVYQQIMAKGANFGFDNQKFFTDTTASIITGANLKYIVALLNSNLVYFAMRNFYMGGGIEGEIKVNNLEKIPIHKINAKNQKIADKIVNLVDKILQSKAQGKDSKQSESQIDDLVYQLYDLTHDEIQIIEAK